MIARWEQKLTDRIHVWGKPRYKLWYFFAVDLMNVYIVSWLVFAALGWITWWTIPVVAFSSWILTLSAQAVVGRERPKFEASTGYKMWWRTYSLPSGHATISAAVATVMLLETHFPNPLALVAVAVAFVIAEILIGIGRIVVGVHYFADIITGFVLGIAFGVVYSVL
jgi:membrane-associated phospholipid phosphatase